MSSEFFTILTDVGKAKIAAALAEGRQISLKNMIVGDGGGEYVEPSENQKNVVREVWRGPLNTLKISPENPAWVMTEAVLAETVGGWYVREVGLEDDEGDLISIGKFPETYKPKLPAGASKQIVIRAVMEVSNAAAVTLMVDPSLVMATVNYVNFGIEEHEKSSNHPDATLTQRGFTQLNSSIDSTLETQAATPKAVKAAYDLANGKAASSHTHGWGQITGVPDATTSQKGIVKLNSATNSTSITEAATPGAVKAAYDLANGKASSSHTHAWGQITGVPDATPSQKGIVKLNSATNSTSITEAATPSAVKAAYDLANGKAASSHTHAWGQITGVPDATTSQKGIVKLNSATNSTSVAEAATSSAVKAAYDRASIAISSFSLFTSNGTFKVPTGVTKVMVEMIGGGGGGGGGGASSGGGGGDSLLVTSVVTVTSGASVSVVVGGGGVGGTVVANSAGNATKGNAGASGGASSFLGVSSAGGIGGLGGSNGGTVSNPATAGSPGSSSPYGRGGEGAAAGSNAATGYGAGGSAGSFGTSSTSCSTGGKGSPGFVKLWW